MADWTTLPAEVRDLVFGTSHLRDVLPLRLVCKSWRDAVSGLRLAYMCNETMAAKKLDGLVKLFPKISTLAMARCTRLTNADLVSLSSLSDLRTLHIMPERLSVLTSLHNVVNSLRSLFVHPLSPLSVVPGEAFAPVTTFQHVVSLSLGSCPLPDALSIPAQLRHLTSLNVYSLPLDDRAGVIAQRACHLPPTLRKLSLSGALRVSRDDMDALCVSLPKLEYFAIYTIGTLPEQRSQIYLSPPSAEGARHLTALLDASVPPSFVSTEAIAFCAKLTRLSAMSSGTDPIIPMENLHKLALSCPQLRVLQISSPPLSNEYLEAMSRFSELRAMTVGSFVGPQPTLPGQPSDDGMRVLTRLKHLSTLSISHIQSLSDASIPIIARLSSLVDLKIVQCPFSSASLANLSFLRRLNSLQLDQMPIDDSALAAIIRSNTALTRLYLSGSQVSTLPEVSQLKGLTDVNLNNCKRIDDATLASLSSLRNLQYFAFSGTPVTGVGFANWKSLSSLTSLSFMPHATPAAAVSVTAEGAKCMTQFLNVVSIGVTVRLEDDTFHAFFSRGQYRTATIWYLKPSQVPSLMLCTTLRTIFLHSPEDEIFNGNAADLITTAIPQLEQFVIRSALGQKVVRGSFSLPPMSAVAKKPAALPAGGGRGRGHPPHP